jgi:carboxyl-terminal processing protease
MNKKDTDRSFLNGSKTPLVGLAIIIVVITGMLIDIRSASNENDDFYEDHERFEMVYKNIHQNYVEQISSKDLVDNAVKGMLKILDPHTSYFDVKDFQELKIHTEGKFGGLGIQISIRDKVLTVMTPIGGTPASRAGIQSGDQIIKIDGKTTAGITIDNAVGKLRGEPGTKVVITVRRKGELKDLDYSITREIIHIKSVPYYGVISDSVGYVQLQTFSEEAGSDVEKAIKELTKKGIKSLVFDLRHNPGGLLPQAIEVSGKFLPKRSLIVSTKARIPNKNTESYSSSNPVLPTDMPLAVLVDYASASASEIVSGAIQDWDRGIILGDTTFGKGSVQEVMPFPNDKKHHMKLTMAYYYTPSGRCINRPENSIRGSQDEGSEDGVNGLSDSTSDSLKTKKSKVDTTTYKTKKNGRLVYGGGGIIPDTIVKQDIPSLPVRSLFIKDLFFQFANVEYPLLKQKKIKIDSAFTIDSSTLKHFYAYLDSIKFKYQSIAQMRFEEFKLSSGIKDTVDSTGKKIELYPDIPALTETEKTELKGLTSKIDAFLIEESKQTLQKNEKEIKKYLRDAILIREFGQDHEVYYRSKLADDAQLKTAIAILSDKNVYSALLKPKVPVKKIVEKKK